MGFVRCGLLAVLALVTLLVGTAPALAAPGGIPGASSLAAQGAAVQANLPAYVLERVSSASQVAKLARLAGGRATLLYALDTDPATLSAMFPQAGVVCERYAAPTWERRIVSYALLLPDGGTSIGALTLSEDAGKSASLDGLTRLLNDAAPTMIAEATAAAAADPAYRYVQSSGRYWVDTPYGRLAFWFSGKMVWNDGSLTKDYWLSHWYQETYPKTGMRTVRVDTTYARNVDSTTTLLSSMAGDNPLTTTVSGSVPVSLGYELFSLPPLVWTYGFVGSVTETASVSAVSWQHVFDPSWKGAVAAKNSTVPAAVCQPGFKEIVPQNADFVANLSGSVGWYSKKAGNVVTIQLPAYYFHMAKPAI
jgi:hypothetical protein